MLCPPDTRCQAAPQGWDERGQEVTGGCAPRGHPARATAAGTQRGRARGPQIPAASPQSSASPARAAGAAGPVTAGLSVSRWPRPAPCPPVSPIPAGPGTHHADLGADEQVRHPPPPPPPPLRSVPPHPGLTRVPPPATPPPAPGPPPRDRGRGGSPRWEDLPPGKGERAGGDGQGDVGQGDMGQEMTDWEVMDGEAMDGEAMEGEAMDGEVRMDKEMMDRETGGKELGDDGQGDEE